MEQPSQPDSRNSGSARLRVLEMIDEGTITAEEGLRLLQAFSAEDETAGTAGKADFPAETAEQPESTAAIQLPGGEPVPPPHSASEITAPASEFLAASDPDAELPATNLSEPPPPSVSQASVEVLPPPAPAALPAAALKWKRWWMLPFWVGVAITVFGGLFMYLAMRSYGISFWFVCASTPFILGVLVIIAAWGSRNAPWLHLRIRQAPGEKPEKIAFSMPLPIRLAAWFVRTFGRWIPGLQDQSYDELILAVGDKTSPDNPLYIVVDEEETGEKVEIYIG
jgi:hypothetical protein